MNFVFVIFSTLISSIFGYLRHKYSYWEFQGVQQLKTHFLFGSLFKLKTLHHSELLAEVYAQFKGKARIAGTYIFTKPVAVALDLDTVKAILIKDFDKFVDRTQLDSDETEPLARHLFALCGAEWRSLRTKLTPTFSSGKMKYMFPSMLAVAAQFADAFERQLDSADGSIELHDMIARYTTDVIGTCVFGIECNSLKDPNVEFRRFGRRIFATKRYSIRWRHFRQTYFATLRWLFGVRRIPRDIETFIMRVVRETVQQREAQQIQRNDFINLLIELKNNPEDVDGGLSIEQIAAQVFLFFVAGFETSSSNMSYALFELARHPEVQQKLRTEIVEVLAKHDDVLSYEAMKEMSYLDQVISETLRKYPALAGLTRIAMEDYEVPNTDIKLERGTRVYIPAKAIHYDPDIYEKPHEFRPERFTPAELAKRHPQAFLGFGDGPRNCIGQRFGRMQVRIGLITLLRSFRFTACAKTPPELEFSKYSFILVPGAGVWLKAEKL